MDNPLQDVISSTKKSMKNAYEATDWWKYTAKEVKKNLFFIVNHLETLGKPFRDLYRASAQFERARRQTAGATINPAQPTILFGPKLTEETYQCGKISTKVALSLEDWSNPNEADVQSCRHLCQQIDALEKLKLFELLKTGAEQSQPAFNPFDPTELFKANPCDKDDTADGPDQIEWEFDEKT